MPTKLKNLIITKVALVDEGSCSAADIKLYKRKEGGNVNMLTFDEVVKSLPAEQQTVITEAVVKAKAELPTGAMSAEDATKTRAQMMAAEARAKKAEEEMAKSKTPAAGDSVEDILKRDDLDPVMKATFTAIYNEAQVQKGLIQKMKEEQENATIIAKASGLEHLPEKDTKVIEFLKSIKGVDGAVDAAIGILKSAEDLIAKGAAFTEIGSGSAAGSTNDAWAKIEKMADEMVKTQTITKAKAITDVIKQKPELYKAYMDSLE